MNLEPYQERVISEQRELNDKLVKLDRFIKAHTAFSTLDPIEQGRLRAQCCFMTGYNEVLLERIADYCNHFRA